MCKHHILCYFKSKIKGKKFMCFFLGTIALPAGEDLTAAPPGSPLTLSLIYSLIHLCCHHLASLTLPPSLLLPSSPLSLPLFISPNCSSLGPLNQAKPLHSLMLLLLAFFFSLSHFHLLLSASLFCCNRTSHLPPLPVLQFTLKVSLDSILPSSAFDISLSKPLRS